MKRTIKIALLACIVLVVSVLTFTACNTDNSTPPQSNDTTSDVTTNETTTDNMIEDTTDGTTEDTTDDTTETETQAHVHAFGEWTITKQASCVKTGEQERACTCGEKETQSIDLVAHTEVIDQAVASTCSATGLTEGKHCSVCNTVLIKQEVVKEKDHAVAIDKAVAPTCTKTGLTEGKHCSVCNTVLVKQEIVKENGHTEVVDKAVAPTCLKTGLTEGKHCSFCKEVLVAQESIKANGHREVVDKAVAPTCTATGLTEGKHCSVCNEVLVKQETVKANGHTEVIDQAVAPTCTETGLTEGKHCSVCNTILVKQETVKENGHTEVVDKAVAPTCLKTGLTEGKHCSVCKEVLVAQESIKANGHREVVDKAVAPTCTATGLTEGKHCSICNEVLVKQETVKANGHTEVIDKAAAPTCTETGLTEGKHCSVCKEILAKQEVVKANGHTEVIDKAVEPTCTETGLTEGKHCSACEEILVKQEIVKALGHTEVIDKAVAPTCTETGLTEGKHCATCGEVLVVQTEVPTLGHNYFSTVTPPTATENGYTTYTCSNCDDSYTEEIVPTNFTVTVENRGQVGFIGEANESLVIPAVFQNDGVWYRVVAIDHSAFAECKSLVYVTIPDSVISMGNFVFFGCSNLATVELGNGITSIGDDVFKRCTSLVEMSIPSSMTRIAHGMFNGCTALTKVVIPNGITHFEDFVFASCASLKEINIPNSVTAIGRWAFYGCTSLTSVTVPMGVMKIEESTFKGCSALISIIIPNHVMSIGDYAFSNCSSLTTITFTGTDEQWNAIEKGNAWEGVGECATYCTNGNICIGHTEVIDAAVSATCTTSGKTEGKHCSVCSTVLVAQEIIPNNGHTEVIDEAVAPTLTESGLTEGKHCDVCETVIVAQRVIIAGSRYGYYDFAELTNGEAMQELYYTLYCICEAFMNSTQNVENVDDYYTIETIDVNAYALTVDEAVAVWKVFYMENPKYYWLSNTITVTGTNLTLCIDEAYATADYREQCDVAIENMVDECYEIITVDLSDLEKALAIHDFILGYMEYAYESDGVTPEDDIWAHNMVGCAKYNLGVCEAYAKTYLYLCLLNNVECIIVSGDAGEDHAWNMICLDGVWYAVDCTWDDTNTSESDYDYFGMSKTYLESTHTAETPDGVGIEYWYALPELSERSLELVELYENGVLVGTFGNIDMAFEAMTNTAGDYTIELYKGSVPHQIYSTETPAVLSLTIVGSIIDLGGGSFTATPVFFNTDVIANSDTYIKNVLMEQEQFYVYGLNIQNFSLTTQGYYCGIYVAIIGDEMSELVIQTDYDTEIFAPINIHTLLQTKGANGVKLRNSSQIDFVNAIRVEIYRCPYTLPNPQIVIGQLNCSDLKIWRFAEISIDKINSEGAVSITFNFGEIEEFAKLSIGELLCSVTLTVDGFITTVVTDSNGNEVNSWTSSVSPFDLQVPIMVLEKLSDFEKIQIWHHLDKADVFATHCYQISDTGEIILKDYTEQNGLIIMDNSVVSYNGTDTAIVIPDGITGIADYAFAYCTELRNITIPNSVISIGDYAFDGCCSLTNITIPSNLESIGKAVFLGCNSLTSITIPDNVTSIGISAFGGCSSLMSVTIGKGVTSIGDFAFYECSSLVEVINHSALDITKGSISHGYVAYYAFDVNSGGGQFNNVDGYLFYTKDGRHYLLKYTGKDTVLTLPESYNGQTYEINSKAFYGCSDLVSVTIPNNVTSIGNEAFRNCYSLTEITLPAGLTSISYGTFMCCWSLTSITIPDSVKSIGSSAFDDCTGLTSIIIPDSVRRIVSYTFSGCSNLMDITIPNTVRNIGHFAFDDCTALTSITFEGTVAQWNTIVFGNDWNRNVPTTEVICSDGIVTLS